VLVGCVCFPFCRRIRNWITTRILFEVSSHFYCVHIENLAIHERYGFVSTLHLGRLVSFHNHSGREVR
jgi:hypothetical protein